MWLCDLFVVNSTVKYKLVTKKDDRREGILYWQTKLKLHSFIKTLCRGGFRMDTLCLMVPLRGICSRQAVWILKLVMVSRVEFWYHDKRISQLRSALPSPYKRCRVSINSPKALGQASPSKAAQQTQKKKKKDTVTPTTTLPPCNAMLNSGQETLSSLHLTLQGTVDQLSIGYYVVPPEYDELNHLS